MLSDVLGALLQVAAGVILVGILAVPVLRGRWWVVPIAVASAASFAVVFTYQPSESFQATTSFKLIEAALNVSLYAGLAALIYGVAAPAKPGSWWHRRNSPSVSAGPGD